MGEDTHPETGICHQRSQTGGIHATEPAADRRVFRQQPVPRGCFGQSLAVLHGQRCQSSGKRFSTRVLIRAGHAAGNGDGFLEPAHKQGTGQQGHSVPPAGCKAEDRDVLRVAAERCDIVPHPVQRLGHVQQGKIARFLRAGAERGQAVEAEQPQPVFQPHEDTAQLLGQKSARKLPRGADLIAAAVQVDDDGPFAGLFRGVNV